MGPLFLAALMLTSTAGAAEPIPLAAESTAYLNQRAVVEWELAVVDPAGVRVVRAGVVRGTWIYDAEKVTLSEVQRVRSSPRTDVVAGAVTLALREGFTALRMKTASPDGVVAGVQGGPLEAPTAPAGDEEPVAPEGAAVETAPPAAAEVPAPPFPDAAPAAAPAASAPDLGPMVRDAIADAVGRMAWSFHEESVVPGEVRTLVEAEDRRVGGAVVTTVKATPLAACPNTGPTRRCVELVVARAEGAAALEGTVPAGSARTLDVWLAEPDTMLPHGGTFAVERAWEAPATDPKPGTWQAKLQVGVTLAPWSPPTSP